jgi:hypothetical protein
MRFHCDNLNFKELLLQKGKFITLLKTMHFMFDLFINFSEEKNPKFPLLKTANGLKDLCKILIEKNPFKMNYLYLTVKEKKSISNI